jgi:hypothetical protein
MHVYRPMGHILDLFNTNIDYFEYTFLKEFLRPSSIDNVVFTNAVVISNRLNLVNRPINTRVISCVRPFSPLLAFVTF